MCVWPIKFDLRRCKSAHPQTQEAEAWALRPSHIFTPLRASCQAVSPPGTETATSRNRKALQRVVRSAQRISWGKLPALQDTYTSRCHRKAKKIIKDNNHPSNHPEWEVSIGASKLQPRDWKSASISRPSVKQPSLSQRGCCQHTDSNL